MTVHHVGIVVRDIHAAYEEYRNITNYANKPYMEHVESQKVDICLLDEEPRLEFIQPFDTTSPVYDFAQKGGGIHHLCFQTENLDAMLNSMHKLAKVIVKPVIGFMGKRVSFLWMRKDIMGLSLIEIVEIKGENKRND